MASSGPSDLPDQLMTSSYHEINDTETENTLKKSTLESQASLEHLDQTARKLFDKARHWVGDLSLEGIVSQEGQQVTYVTQDLTEKIKLSSPTKDQPIQSSRNDSVVQRRLDTDTSTSGLAGASSDDLNIIINEIELEAKKLASSVDTLTENLSGILHSLSSMTVDCTFVASDAVTQLCDTADASIKVMYQVMAKSEELNKAVQPIYHLHQQIKDTKRLLDKVEAEMN